MPSVALINKEDEVKKVNIGLIGMEVMGTNLALIWKARVTLSLFLTEQR